MRSFRFARLHVAMVFTLLAGIFMAPSAIKAQDSSSMTGVVTDATGAFIPGATITLANKSTGTSYTQTSSKEGVYHFANVPPGEGYTATFAHAGFASLRVNNLSLNVGITRTQDAQLAAGANEEVEVSASNSQVTLNTTDASIGNNIDVQELNRLPVLDRTTGITDLFTLQPGVEFVNGAVTGARTDQTELTVDGMDASDITTGQFGDITVSAPIDSVEQFTGTVAGLTPSVGTGSGGQFQMVTKHGTNLFHGNINEYHRDTTTEANSWFNNLDGLPRTPLIRNQFGGNIGGPIIRNKLFFFFDYAGSRIVQSGTAEPTVPLSNLYGSNPTLNYINNGPGCGDQSRINIDPTCITSIPNMPQAGFANSVQGLDPAHQGFSQGLLTFVDTRYPQANDLTAGDGVNTGGYRFTYPSPVNQDTYVTRVDYNLTPHQKIFGRFTIDRLDQTNGAPVFGTDPLTTPLIDHSYSYVVSHVWTLSTNKVNQFYYGDTIEKYNFPVLFTAPTNPFQYSFSGLTTPYKDGPQARRIPIPMIRDDFNWQHGSHSISFGGTFKWIKSEDSLTSNYISPSIGLGGTGSTFNGGLDAGVQPSDIYTGSLALNDYNQLFATTLGTVATVSTNFDYNNKGVPALAGTGFQRFYRYFQTELYVGDTWKVTPKLTLSYGLRYMLYTVPYEAKGAESVQFDEATGKPIDPESYFQDRIANIGNTSPTGNLPIYSFRLGGKANNGPAMYRPSYKDFAPRFSFAYSPNPKTVINGSANIVYDRTLVSAVTFLLDQFSFLFENSNETFTGQGAPSLDSALATAPRVGANLAYDTSIDPAPLPVTPPTTPFIGANGVPIGLPNNEFNFTVSPTLKDPYSIALNAGIQQAFPGHMIMKLNYVGRMGRRLIATQDESQILDAPDLSGKSTQTLAGAFAGLESQLRAGTALTPQPWFENNLQSGIAADFGFPSSTALVAAIIGQLGNNGDMGDSIVSLASFGYGEGIPNFFPSNVGMPEQFAGNLVLGNKGSSSYNALLLTLDKNLSQGLQFNFNYTWSHSIDNTSLIANNNPLTQGNPAGLICDLTRPRACRGSSDFDDRQEISSSFTYDLPVGHGKRFLATSPRWLDEVIGGWSLSGIPRYRTGLALNVGSEAFIASSENDSPAIFSGNRSDLKIHVNTDHSSNTVYAFAGGLAGANKALADFRGPLGLEYGQRNLFNGPSAFYLDAGLGKTFPIIEQKLSLEFRADAFNVLNHPNFGLPTLNIVANASPFGQETGISTAGPGVDGRVAQFSARLQF